MCSGIEYEGELLVWQDADVRLPVKLRDGSMRWLRWGERHGVASAFVQGPCARLESIHAGRWDRHAPQPVQIPAERYMERDARGRPVWVRTAPGQCLQGLVANQGDEQRVYVVTVEAPEEFRHVQARWPRLLAP